MSRPSKLANAVPSLVLASPAHRVLSGRYAVLEFTGRRSGRTYRTPVAYVRDGSRVLLSTEINDLSVITSDVVEAARSTLVIGDT